MNQADRLMLEIHRRGPTVLISKPDAGARGIRNVASVRLFNDVSSFQAEPKVSGAVRPGQVISYNGWEPYQHVD